MTTSGCPDLRSEPDLWSEIDAEIGAVPDVLRPEPRSFGDAEWLRRAPYSRALDEACGVVVERHGLHRVLVQGARARTLRPALGTLGDALEFPGYYGQNLDAMNECLLELLVIEDGRFGAYLRDRVGRRAAGILLMIDDAEYLLVDETPEVAATFFAVLRGAARPGPGALGQDERGRTDHELAPLYVLLLDRR